jgi:cardiolipin synthase
MAAGYPSRRFPWREGNHFRLLVDGGEIFPAMLAAIESAQSQILLEMYLVESGSLSDYFLQAFCAAARRGVAVYLLLDDFGARGLRQADRRLLLSAGVQLSFYNPLRYGELRRNLLRDHRKVLVVDDQQAFVSGLGLTDEFDPQARPKSYWHEVAVHVVGPCVRDWDEAFRRNWQTSAPPQAALPQAPRLQADLPPAEQAGRVASGRYFGAVEIHRAFVKRVRGAERQVWMMTAYFVPSRRLRRALRQAAGRGVDVRLLLPGPITDHPAIRYAGRRFYTRLLRAGVRIFEYQPRFLHAKVLLCDGWVSLGSSNVDRWNMRWNLEGNQEVEDSDFATEVQMLFEGDFLQSEECRLPVWQKRPWYWRLREWFWGYVDRLLDWYSQRPRR